MSTHALDRLDDLIVATNNDELIELSYRVFEELADRVGSVARIALEEGDRDLINEAFVFTQTADSHVPMLSSHQRIKDVYFYIDHVEKELKEAIDERANGEEPKTWRYLRVRETPAMARVAAKKRAVEDAKAEELLASVDMSREAVLGALRAATADGPAQMREIALMLCPEAEPADTPGRQKLINRVGQTVRKLAAEGLAVKASEPSYEKRVTCRWLAADSLL